MSNIINQGPLSSDFPDPRDGIRKMSGMKQEEHHRIVAASLKMMGVKEADIPDHERLLMEARARIKNVRDYAQVVYDNHIAGGIPFKPEILGEEVFKKLLVNFDHYNRDELLLFLTRFLAEDTMRRFT